MLTIDPVTASIGATISGLDFSQPIPASAYDEVYQALLQEHVIFIHGVEIAPKEHLAFAQNFGDLDDPHPLYPHVDGFQNIVV
jgi:taurine dioxygenase